ncbi:queuosine salvage protein-like protein, partial [Tanacetum coccineum]
MSKSRGACPRDRSRAILNKASDLEGALLSSTASARVDAVCPSSLSTLTRQLLYLQAATVVLLFTLLIETPLCMCVVVKRFHYSPKPPMEEVRSTSAWVASHASHVTIDSEVGLEKVVSSVENSIPKVEWNYEGIHYFDNGPLTIQYLFVLDALNFCFWPDKDLNYDDLASGLKAALENDKSVFDADRLQKYTGLELRQLLKWPRPLPLEDERVRLMHEVGFELERSFGGKASNIVESCGKSATNLVSTIARHFPGFRDHTVYKGHQVFLYKRAQIFAADVWGAFKGQGFGEFSDVGSITIFADYIVPAVLQQLGVLRYSSTLADSIQSNKEIGSGT